MGTTSERLRQARKRAGMTQAAVARRLAVTPSVLARYESGLNDPSSDNLRRLADIYQVSCDYLLGRADDARPASLPAGAYPMGPMVKVPVLGEIRAGMPLLAQHNVVGWGDVPAEDVRDGQYFFLQVVGDSMIEAHILPGSRVLVRMQPEVSPGDVAVVMINEEEATLKRVRVMDAQVLLYPANSNYVPTVHPIQQVKIIGKVVKAEISFT